MKKNYEFYVALSPNGEYYHSFENWIPEGEELIIDVTDNIEDADRFDSIEEIEQFKKDVEESRELYEGKYTIAEGEFNPIKIFLVKAIYETIED